MKGLDPTSIIPIIKIYTWGTDSQNTWLWKPMVGLHLWDQPDWSKQRNSSLGLGGLPVVIPVGLSAEATTQMHISWRDAFVAWGLGFQFNIYLGTDCDPAQNWGGKHHLHFFSSVSIFLKGTYAHVWSPGFCGCGPEDSPLNCLALVQQSLYWRIPQDCRKQRNSS